MSHVMIGWNVDIGADLICIGAPLIVLGGGRRRQGPAECPLPPMVGTVAGGDGDLQW